MKTIPQSAVFYKSTAVFTQDSVPAALQRDHTTAQGVWGRIVVLEGSLAYHVIEPTPEVHALSPGIDGVVEPTMRHHIELMGSVRLRIDFYR